MIEQLPCASCTALCCGPVPITGGQLGRIREHLQTMSAGERKRLARQSRDDLQCRFLDAANYRCTIYPVRPWVCEAYGRTEGLECPKVGKLVQILPAIVVEMKQAEERSARAVGNSIDWNWRKMEFDHPREARR